MTVELYSDINKETPTEKARIINMEAIKNSIRNALNFKATDILFDNTLLGAPEEQLFEQITEDKAFSLKNMLKEIIEQDNRVKLDYRNTKVEILNGYTGFLVTLIYYLKEDSVPITQRFEV